ncbi:MAG: putative signal peptide protein [Gammaproteobacteria bacterium]|nr:putative signal peptide protein [Gammaproteobacteria bacterium]
MLSLVLAKHQHNYSNDLHRASGAAAPRIVREAEQRILAKQEMPVILVGHSYGGAVITEAGNDPRVAGLVYIAAFAPDKGESVASLIKDPPAGAPVPPILPPQDGYLLLDVDKFPASFAADVPLIRPLSWPTHRFHQGLGVVQSLRKSLDILNVVVPDCNFVPGQLAKTRQGSERIEVVVQN